MLETDCTAHAPTILKNQTGDIVLFSRWQRNTSLFYLLLLTVCYLCKYLIGNIWNIPLSEAEAWLPFDGLKFYIAPCLRAGRVLEFFRGT
jgi:hypothetical protein